MPSVPAIFAFLCAAAGWYYVWHASAAGKLAGLERSRDNQLRIRLRRFGGVGMVLMSAAFYIGYKIADNAHGNPIAVMLCLLCVGILLPIVLFLAWADMRLTRKMRESMRDRNP